MFSSFALNRFAVKQCIGSDDVVTTSPSFVDSTFTSTILDEARLSSFEEASYFPPCC